MINVLLVEDHQIVRDGYRKILEDMPEVSEIEGVGDGREAISKTRRKFYKIIILDVGLPDMNGLNLLKIIKQEQPGSKVLMLSMYPEEQYAIRSIKAGASGYLTKSITAEDLIKAVYKVSRGGKYITNTVAEKLAAHLDEHEESPKHEELSDREYQVLRLISRGNANKEIAEKLSLSSKTVSTYRTRIFEKMGFENNTDLIQYTLKNKILL